MKRFIIFLALSVLGIIQVQAQSEMPDRKGKFFLVPEFWLSFGSSTYIEVAPLLGYHVNDRFSLGLGPHYIYQSWKNDPFPPTQTHVYGMKGFARFALITNAEQFLPINLFNDLFAHVEYEGMSLERDIYYQQGDEGRFIYHGFLVGGGFNQRIGMYNAVSFMVLWDLNESSRSPYSNPVFRIGFNAYF
ncbi:MAG: hypothetical protein KAT15_00740 [Bacteroidales bacterium]|nr:hypothetical protein [Bacteroidales bacterium]